MKVGNSKAEVFYGMHFYPGVARYEAVDAEPLTVFINESTIRKMGPSFAGRPVFVEHVDEVNEDLHELRNEADGWVVESFFNEADGKHWVKFMVVSEAGFNAIKRGFRLSNAYIPQLGPGAMWNGVPYQKEVIDGEFDHLALVSNPRYEESVIMTPDQFKKYNDEQAVELRRLANSKDTKETKMKLNIFKRQKVENSIDLDGMVVELPKSKKEVTITKMVEEYDKIMNMNGYANGDHMVKVGEKDEMSVNDLVKKHLEMANEFGEMKAKNAAKEEGGEPGGDEDDESMDNDDEVKREAAGAKDVSDRGGDESLNNEDDEDDDKDKKKDKMKNAKELEAARKLIAKDKAARLKNANFNVQNEDAPTVSLPQDQVARGKALYGSGN